jgi:hypothetical protein
VIDDLNGTSSSNGTSQAAEERKTYTTKLQRRAQAHVTAELGREMNEDGLDRQVVMLVQHALDTTHARRVSLFRPISRGRRWHVVTAFDDGTFHYGLVPPDNLALPMAAYVQRRPLIYGPDHPFDPAPGVPAAPPSELGIRSYLGLPLQAGPDVFAVLEVVNISQPDLLERHVTSLEPALAQLTVALTDDARVEQPEGWATAAPVAAPAALELSAVCDLVLRPAGDPDDPFEVVADEWKLLLHLNGERTLEAAAELANLAPAAAAAIAGKLLDRGLIRTGKENRRRG